MKKMLSLLRLLLFPVLLAAAGWYGWQKVFPPLPPLPSGLPVVTADAGEGPSSLLRNVAWVEGSKGNASASIPKLLLPVGSWRLPLSNIQARSSLGDNNLLLQSFSATLPGQGTLDMAASLRNPAALDVQASLDAGNAGILLRSLSGKPWPAGGSARLSLQTATSGNTGRQWLEKASGLLTLEGSDIPLSDSLLAALGSTTLRLIKPMLGLTPREPVTARCMGGTWRLKQGIIHSRSTLLQVNQALVALDGSINLLDETLNLQTTFFQPGKDKPLPLALGIGGTFEQPRTQPGTTALAAGKTERLQALPAPARECFEAARIP